jgi:putrescine transport system permease protein
MKNRFCFGTFLEKNKKRLNELYVKASNINFVLGNLTIIWIVVFLIIPLIVIMKISLAESTFGIPPYTEISMWAKKHVLQICLNLHNYFVLFRDTYYKTALFNSLSISAITTVICAIIGYMMAYGIALLPPKKKMLLIALVSVSFWTSFLIRVYSWLILLGEHGFLNSILLKIGLISSPIQFLGNYYIVCLGAVFCYLPFMIFPVYATIEKADKSCIEAAFDLGASPFKTFLLVTIPLTKSGIIAGCTLVFSTTMGEFIIPELLGGADTVTIGRIMWIEFFNNIDWPIACALSIVLTTFIILPLFFFMRKTYSK